MEIDDLWRETKASIIVERKAKEVAAIRRISADPDKIETQRLFLNPENWIAGRGIALIHEETGTVLGTFIEHLHNSVKGCRKLLPATVPTTVCATEIVSGSWWLGENRRIEPVQVWHEKKVAILHIHLSELRVHSPATEVIVHLSYGSIARVELAVDTQFAQEDGQQEQLLFLPASTNIIEVMSRDCKISLRKEIGL